MFLITTADQRFWKFDEPVIFLGEWCKLFSQRHIWEKLKYEVLPYHWDDRKKLYKDYLYLDNLYEKILVLLVRQLNQVHGVHYSLRYWRIIIGPWLYYFIQILYDRYQCIIVAAESKKVTDTLIGEYDYLQWLPRDCPEFMEWSVNDDYNHYLYSWIIRNTNKVPFKSISVGRDINLKTKYVSNNRKFSFSFRNFLKFFIENYEKVVPVQFNEIVLVSTYLDLRDLVKLQFGLWQFPYLLPPCVRSIQSSINEDLRAGLLYSNLTGNEFEQLLSKLIKEQIPSVYVEGYFQMNKASLAAYPRNPKVILNADAWYANEAFKFWAAYQVECGVKFAGVQHGGLYGIGLWNSTESHEVSIYDRFYTWGWKADGNEKTKPLPAAKLNTVRNTRPKKDGRLLLVLGAVPRYSYYMYSVFVSASGMLSYFNDQYQFVKNLSKTNQKLLLIRLYQHDYGWGQARRWDAEFPEIECYAGNKLIVEQFNESRLFIGTYNATSYLESFAADFPTVLFWNPHYWEIRDSAKPYFEELRNVGILYDNPEDAACKVNEISFDPISWWQQSIIQEAKNRFCNQFARTSDNWLKEWRDELSSLKF